MMTPCECEKNGNEIFIIDKDVVNYFFKDENYEASDLFFVYLTTHCKTKKAYMIPALFDEIILKLKKSLADAGKTKETEIISYFENWIERAELLGEDQGEEKHDTMLLFRILSMLNEDKKVVIISNKYLDEESVTSLSPDDLWGYLKGKPDYMAYLKDRYGFEDGASY